MPGLIYRPGALSPEAFNKNLQRRYGIDLAFEKLPTGLFDRVTGLPEMAFVPTMSDRVLQEKISGIPVAEQQVILQRMGRVATLQTTRRDVEQIFSRNSSRAWEISHSQVFRVAKSQGRSAADLDVHFADFSVGQNITTHPLQFASEAEEKLNTEYATKYERYLRLTKGTRPENNARRDPKILAEIRQLTSELKTLEQKLAKMPLYNERTPSALEEARLKLDPLERHLHAMADEVVSFRKAAVRHYPELLNTQNNLFQRPLYEYSAWLALDNDRNALLKPEEAFVISNEKIGRAFGAHTSYLDGIGRGFDGQIGQDLQLIRQRLAASAASMGHFQNVAGDFAQDVTRFENAEEYIASLRELQERVKPNSRQFWDLERAVSRAQIGGFHFVAGEGRQNCLDITLLTKTLYAAEHKVAGAEFEKLSLPRKLLWLEKHLNNPDGIDLSKIDLSHLSATDQKNVKKFIEWIFQYKNLHDKFGPKMMERVILAENSSPWQILAMRVFMGSVGIDTGVDGTEVRPLVETAFDHNTFRRLAKFVSDPSMKRLVDLVFPKGLAFMQATSDTSRKEGLLYAYHSVVAFGMKVLELFPKTMLYFGTGGNTQRFGKMFAFQQIMNIPSYYVKNAQARIFEIINPIRARITTQGDHFMREARSYGLARSNGGLLLTNFFARSLGVGNDPAPELNKIPREIAYSAHKYYQSFVAQSGTYNNSLNELTPVMFESGLNKGSRSGTGPIVKLAKIFKVFEHDKMRAIGLSAATEISGTPGTVLGHGHAIADWIGNNPHGYDILHERYRNNIHFRQFIQVNLKAMPTSDTAIMELINGDKIQNVERLSAFVDFARRDFELMKTHLPKIIEGSKSTKIWNELLTRENPGYIRLGRMMTTMAHKAVQSIPLEQVLLRVTSRSLNRTTSGKAVNLVLNGMAAFMRVIRTSG